MSRAVLVDLVRCMGCRGCQVACKSWNGNPCEDTQCEGSYENPPSLSASTWTRVRFNEVEEAGNMNWVFAKQQCMHCEHPACVSACPVQALHKLESGPVVYDAERCIGCRYCMVACPFHVPQVDFNDNLPVINKCKFCADRVDEGLEPACVKACPTGALTFGDREALLEDGRQRIAARPDKYVNYIYGEHEAGGTSWMYLSPVSFAAIGFPMLDANPVPKLSETVATFGTPTALATVGATLAGVYWITKRRMKAMAGTEQRGEEDG
jgi:formate dehydrogenase iron-sulfur subunit